MAFAFCGHPNNVPSGVQSFDVLNDERLGHSESVPNVDILTYGKAEALGRVGEKIRQKSRRRSLRHTWMF